MAVEKKSTGSPSAKNGRGAPGPNKEHGSRSRHGHPETTGKYRLGEVVGEGAMGVVYKAFDPHIERVVAIKVIKRDQVSESQWAELQARFQREAKAAGRLLHPNIVTVHEYGEDGGSPYLVMEYMEGVSLAQYIKQKGRLSVKESYSIMKKLLDALEYSHSKGVIHRDIKPQNVFILENLEVKLSDFGIAKMESSDLTKPGMVLGTPVYMSPEQIRAEKVDARSDLFSAGVIFYEMIAGERPFAGAQLATLIHKILNETPRDPCSLNPDLPEAFRDIFAKALAKKPEERYQTARQFLTALQETIENSPTLVIEHPPKPPGKNRLAVVALAILLVVGIAGAGIWHWIGKSPENGTDVETVLEKTETTPDVEEDSSKTLSVETRDASTDARTQAETHDAGPGPEVEETPYEQQATSPTPAEETDIEPAEETAVSEPVEETRGDLPDADESVETETQPKTEQSTEEMVSQPESPGTEPEVSSQEERVPSVEPAAEPEPKPKPSPAKSLVLIESEPKGANVYIDGKWVGVTPFQGPVEPGNHRLELKKSGFKPMADEFSVEKGTEGPFEYNAELYKGRGFE